MSVSMQNDIDILPRKRSGFRWNMLQSKLQPAAGQIDHQRPIEIAIAISAHDHDRRPDRAQFIQNSFRANIAQMPDLIRVLCKIDNLLRQFVMRIGQNENLCHVVGGGSAAPSGDVLNAASRLTLASSKGLLDPPRVVRYSNQG